MPGPTKFIMDKRWKRLEKKFGAAASRSLARKYLRKATMVIGKKAEATIRKEIETGKFEPNAPLTVGLKGGKNEPLKGTRPGAPLFKAITSKMIDDYTVFVGVLQTDDEYNIALAIHEGTTIGVTDKMRGLFHILSRHEADPSIPLSERAQELWDAMPGGWKPLKPSTVAIIIPSRPFIQQAFDKGDMQKFAQKFWHDAFEAAIKELGSQ